MAVPDDQLLAAVREGDVYAFEQLFRVHYADLLLYARNLIQNTDIAEDIVQQVFISVWHRRAGFETTRSMRGYLFSAVRHRAWNVRRDTGREIRRREEWAREQQISHDLPPSDETDAFACVARLTGHDREVLDLRLRGLTLAEIGETLGVPLQTAAARVRRATERLREFVTRDPGA